MIRVNCCVAEDKSRFPLNPASEWRINYEIMDDDALQQNGDEIFRIYIENDTLINSKIYYKLYKSGHSYFDPIFYYEQVYMGAIRDEANKYYFIKKDNPTEELLYDFDLETGDTIFSTVEKGMKVTSVEEINGGRRKINFEKTDFLHGECMNFNNTYLIEGIGSMGGLFYESPCNHVGFREHCLVCYYENGNIIYQNNLTTRNCISVTSVPHITSNFEINMYPIPAESKLIVECKDWTDEIANFQICHISGTKVYSGIMSTNCTETEINLQNLSSGIYIFKIFNSSACLSKRFIIE